MAYGADLKVPASLSTQARVVIWDDCLLWMTLEETRNMSLQGFSLEACGGSILFYQRSGESISFGGPLLDLTKTGLSELKVGRPLLLKQRHKGR